KPAHAMSQCAARCSDGKAKTSSTTHGTSKSAASPNSGTTQRGGRQPAGSVKAPAARVALEAPLRSEDISLTPQRRRTAADSGCSPDPARVEQMGRSVPDAGSAAKAYGEHEERHQEAPIDAGPDAA